MRVLQRPLHPPCNGGVRPPKGLSRSREPRDRVLSLLHVSSCSSSHEPCSMSSRRVRHTMCSRSYKAQALLHTLLKRTRGQHSPGLSPLQPHRASSRVSSAGRELRGFSAQLTGCLRHRQMPKSAPV